MLYLFNSPKNSIFYFLILALFTISCSTSMHKLIQEVQVGMDKSEVLEKLGPPYKSYRSQSIDRWIYKQKNLSKASLSSPSKISHLEIHFKNSKVIYVGYPPPPPLSPEAQDAETYDEYKKIIELEKKRSPSPEDFEEL